MSKDTEYVAVRFQGNQSVKWDGKEAEVAGGGRAGEGRSALAGEG